MFLCVEDPATVPRPEVVVLGPVSRGDVLAIPMDGGSTRKRAPWDSPFTNFFALASRDLMPGERATFDMGAGTVG